MTIGVPKEIKAQENRVAVTPAGVMNFVEAGHTVYVEKDAGVGSGFIDAEYEDAGAIIMNTPDEIFRVADMIYKVKEPLAEEYGLLREGQTVFTYLHLAPDIPQTKALISSKIIGIAYETVQLSDGSLPLLAPMSAIAGRMSVMVGANMLQKVNNGSGVLLGGVPGVAPGHVVIIGGGIAGFNAMQVAVGLGARVTVIDISHVRLTYMSNIMSGRIATLMSNSYNISQAVAGADLLISSVLIPGARSPKVVTEKMVMKMRPGSVIVDIAIDQGGSVETIDRLTSHDDPYYLKHNVVHYSVPNMPGAVPRTSTIALSNATMPYALEIANNGPEAAMRTDPALLKGLNVYKGRVTNKSVAESQGIEYSPPGFMG